MKIVATDMFIPNSSPTPEILEPPKASPFHQYFHMPSHMGVDDAEACKAHAILSRGGIAARWLHLFWPVRQWPCARRSALTCLVRPLVTSGLVEHLWSSGGNEQKLSTHTTCWGLWPICVIILDGARREVPPVQLHWLDSPSTVDIFHVNLSCS